MLVGVASLPHTCPPEYRHFTVETGKTAYTFATQCKCQKGHYKARYLQIIAKAVKTAH